MNYEQCEETLKWATKKTEQIFNTIKKYAPAIFYGGVLGLVAYFASSAYLGEHQIIIDQNHASLSDTCFEPSQARPGAHTYSVSHEYDFLPNRQPIIVTSSSVDQYKIGSNYNTTCGEYNIRWFTPPPELFIIIDK